MNSPLIIKAATVGFLALLPFTLAATSASAQQTGRHPLSATNGLYKVAPGVTKAVVNLQKESIYTVCASRENAEPVSVHFDGKKTEALRPGECHDFEAKEIKIENPAKVGFAHGTFFKHDAMSDELL